MTKQRHTFAVMQKTQSQTEFVVLMASLMSMVALSIDAILPASEIIGTSIGITNPSNKQLLITTIFLGLGFGQLFFGPISDSIGRKPTILIGFCVFLVASIICVYAESLEMMLVGRVLQGIGLSASRTVCITMVRDMFSGDYMGRIMSFITMIFLIVPLLAPSIGSLILSSYGWEAIFKAHVLYCSVVIIWLYIRQPETLKDEHKVSFSLDVYKKGLIEFFKSSIAITYTLISGLITGAFMVYLSASENIINKHFDKAEDFALIFASMASCSIIGTFLNAKLVLLIGMKKMVLLFLGFFLITPLIYIILFHEITNPPFEIFLIFCGLQLFYIGFLFGNLRSLAMEPLGHIAGIGASINGFISTIMAVPLATFVGNYITKSSLPIFIGYSSCALLSLILLLILKKSKESNWF